MYRWKNRHQLNTFALRRQIDLEIFEIKTTITRNYSDNIGQLLLHESLIDKHRHSCASVYLNTALPLMCLR